MYNASCWSCNRLQDICTNYTVYCRVHPRYFIDLTALIIMVFMPSLYHVRSEARCFYYVFIVFNIVSNMAHILKYALLFEGQEHAENCFMVATYHTDLLKWDIFLCDSISVICFYFVSLFKLLLSICFANRTLVLSRSLSKHMLILYWDGLDFMRVLMTF